MVTDIEYNQLIQRKMTKSDIENILGVKMKKIGHDYVCQCPVCQDSGCDNLHFKEGEYLKCFSCAENEGASYVYKLFFQGKKREFMENNMNEKPRKCIRSQSWYKNQEKYVEYMAMCNDFLLNNQKLLDELYEVRGLTRETIGLVGMGFDEEKKLYVIPIFSLLHDSMITDFEYRQYGKAFGKNKKVFRKGGGENTVAIIYGLNNAKKMLITEGFLDGYMLKQFMKEKKQKEFLVCSCSHGVNSLVDVIGQVDFSMHSEIKLILDNDEAGDKATDTLIDKYRFLQDGRGVLKRSGCKDINDWVLSLRG